MSDERGDGWGAWAAAAEASRIMCDSNWHERDRARRGTWADDYSACPHCGSKQQHVTLPIQLAYAVGDLDDAWITDRRNANGRFVPRPSRDLESPSPATQEVRGA